MQPVSRTVHTLEAPVAPVAKLNKASQEFEALLLKELLGPLQETFATIPGEDSRSGPNMYGFMGTEYLALGLARAGGLGIGRMIVGELNKPGVIAKVIPK